MKRKLPKLSAFGSNKIKHQTFVLPAIHITKLPTFPILHPPIIYSILA